jgi:hypothetical protein
MAWENRGRGRYFYLNRRREGRVVKTYYGPGAIGEVAAGLLDEARRKRADQAAELKAMQARFAAPDRAMSALDEVCALAVEAALTAAGYHRCSYKWRRKHVRRTRPGNDSHAWRG